MRYQNQVIAKYMWVATLIVPYLKPVMILMDIQMSILGMQPPWWGCIVDHGIIRLPNYGKKYLICALERLYFIDFINHLTLIITSDNTVMNVFIMIPLISKYWNVGVSSYAPIIRFISIVSLLITVRCYVIFTWQYFGYYFASCCIVYYQICNRKKVYTHIYTQYRNKGFIGHIQKCLSIIKQIIIDTVVILTLTTVSPFVLYPWVICDCRENDDFEIYSENKFFEQVKSYFMNNKNTRECHFVLDQWLYLSLYDWYKRSAYRFMYMDADEENEMQHTETMTFSESRCLNDDYNHNSTLTRTLMKQWIKSFNDRLPKLLHCDTQDLNSRYECIKKKKEELVRVEGPCLALYWNIIKQKAFEIRIFNDWNERNYKPLKNYYPKNKNKWIIKRYILCFIHRELLVTSFLILCSSTKIWESVLMCLMILYKYNCHSVLMTVFTKNFLRKHTGHVPLKLKELNSVFNMSEFFHPFRLYEQDTFMTFVQKNYRERCIRSKKVVLIKKCFNDMHFPNELTRLIAEFI